MLKIYLKIHWKISSFTFDTADAQTTKVINQDDPLNLRATKRDLPHAMHYYSQYCHLSGGEIFINGGRNSVGIFPNKSDHL